MPSLSRLSVKQKAFAKKFVETQNATTAAMESYTCKNRKTAGALGCRVMKDETVRNEIDRLLEEKNITDDFMAQRLREGMDAKVISSFRGDVEETDIPDHNTAFKWWEAAAKMKDMFPAGKLETKNINIDLELETMSKEDLSVVLKGLLSSIKKQNNGQQKENRNLKEDEK